MTTPTKFSKERLDQFYDYEEIRLGGLFNMHDLNAVTATGLSHADYTFVQQNYAELRQAFEIEEDARIMALAESRGH